MLTALVNTPHPLKPYHPKWHGQCMIVFIGRSSGNSEGAMQPLVQPQPQSANSRLGVKGMFQLLPALHP